ncbi:MAG: DHH family phosphoesterase [Clostridia bacterium]|nr:DHH family phosphoesterase [Clostridia bacterium]
MNAKTKKGILALIVAAAVCLASAAGYFIGRSAGQKELRRERESLISLNRAGIENMSVENGPVYVIGHRSPDTDTVCSAVAFAKLLTELGYPAEAAVTEAPNRETAYLLKEAGVETPPVLEDASGKSIFLVDHSEYSQAAAGLADAHIVGILDHHGIGNVSTGYQVVYEAKPIGAAATVVWLDYLNYGVGLDKTTAYLLLGAVLSDTDNLTGSTVTEADRQAVSRLAELADVTDVDALYRAIHTEKLSYEGMSSEEILFSDYKEYEASGVKFGIGLVNAIDEETAIALAKRMQEILPDSIGTTDAELMYACVGIRENGEKIDRIVPADERSREMFEAAFPDYDEFDGVSFVFRSGLGRKTKFVPGLTEYLAAHPHE